jgi:hypothetical protein
MELYSSESVRFEDCDFFSNREFTLIFNNASENTVFRGCRFFGNWAEAPLFESSEDIELYGCEIYHPVIGAQNRLVAPAHDNKFGEDAGFIPERRKQPIGPDEE